MRKTANTLNVGECIYSIKKSSNDYPTLVYDQIEEIIKERTGITINCSWNKFSKVPVISTSIPSKRDETQYYFNKEDAIAELKLAKKKYLVLLRGKLAELIKEIDKITDELLGDN